MTQHHIEWSRFPYPWNPGSAGHVAAVTPWIKDVRTGYARPPDFLAHLHVVGEPSAGEELWSEGITATILSDIRRAKKEKENRRWHGSNVRGRTHMISSHTH